MSKQTNILPKHASFRTLCYRGFCVFCLLLERFGKISFKNGLCRLFCGIALAAVFDDDRHGNLRVLVRRKADERQVIGMVGVFRRAGLARNGNAEIRKGRGRRALCAHLPHALAHDLEIFVFDLRF